jgi:RHS repeat-associated protein
MALRTFRFAASAIALLLVVSCGSHEPIPSSSALRGSGAATAEQQNEPKGFLNRLWSRIAPRNSISGLSPRAPATLVVPPNTIGATTPNGTTYTKGTLHPPLTDDLAPEADVSVGPDGSASVHVPLWVPPGRAGMQPSISIDYNSRASLGVSSATLGYGWQVSGFPMIHRCARTAADSSDGISSQIAFTPADQICLDGEPLIPEDPSMQVALNSVYRTLHDSHRRFVITAVDPQLGPTMIVAYGRDGRITTWGIPPNVAGRPGSGGVVDGNRYSFQTNPTQQGWQNINVGATTVRYGWLLSSIADHNGNEIDYTWWNFACDSNTDFIPGTGPVFAPLTISYTSNTVSGLDPRKFVTFHYDTISCSHPVGQNSVFIAGMRFEPRMQVTGIEMTGPNNDGSATVPLRRYYFNYGNDVATPQLPQYSTRAELTDILECDGADVCKPGIHFSYGEIGPLDGEWADITVPSASVGVVQQDISFPPRMYIADLNGDGHDDLLYGQAVPGQSPTNYVAQLSTGTVLNPTLGPVLSSGPNFSQAGRLFPNDFSAVGYAGFVLQTFDSSGGSATLLGLNPSTHQFQTGSISLLGTTAGEMADLNGDGLPDLIEATTSITNPPLAWDWRQNNGQGGFANQVSGNHLPLGPNDHRLVDVDGDGSMEVLTVLPVDPSRYAAVHAGTTPVSGPSAPTTLDFLSQSTPRPYVFADINGDGLTDAVQLGASVGDGTIYIRFNSGNGFFPPVTFTPSPQYAFGDEWSVRTIDFNADGKQDLLFRDKNPLNPQNQPLYALWFDGLQMQLTQLPVVHSSTNPVSPDDAKNQTEMFEVGDVNGDGLDDIIMVNDFASNQPTGTLHLFVRQGSALRNRQLIGVDRTGLTRNGINIPGEETEIWYSSIADPSVYTNVQNCSFDFGYPDACVAGKLQVVSRIRRRDDSGTGLPLNDTLYSYTTGHRDMRGRGFLGFEQITARRLDAGITASDFYDLQAQEGIESFYPFVGIPFRTDTSTSYVSNGTLMNWTRSQASSLVTVHTTNGSYFVYPRIATDSVKETNANGTSNVLYMHTTNESYNPNGEFLLSTTTREDGSTDHVGHIYTYATDGSVWPHIATDVITETSTTASDTLSRQSTISYDANWNLSSATSLPSGNDRGEEPLTVTYTPTAEGLPGTITFSESAARGGITRSIGYTYDNLEHAFPAVVADTLNHTHRYAIHPGYGLPAISEDENHLQSVYTYDGLGRPITATLPTGEQSSYDYVSLAGDPYAPVEPDTLVRIVKQLNDGARAVTEMNWRGDLTARREWSRSDGRAVYETYSYDSQERLLAHYLPSFTLPTTSSKSDSRTFDSLGRIKSEQRADGSHWTYTYQGLARQALCANDHRHQTIYLDGQGRIAETADFLSGRIIHNYSTTYAYGPFDSLYSITDAEGNITTRQVNRLGSLWKITDPDSGTHIYGYNAFGQPETERTPEFTTTRFYDEVGRIKTETTGARVAAYTWDSSQYGIGKLGYVVSPDQITTTFDYDSKSRPNLKTWTIGAEQLSLSQSFDDTNGHLRTVTYPKIPGQSTAFGITYNYDTASGALQSITDSNTPTTTYWTWKDADPSGRFVTDLFGNNVTNKRVESTTNPTTLGEIQVTLNVGTTVTPLRDVSYTVDAQRSVTSRVDNLNGTSETFGYDSLNRLSTWTWRQGSVVKQLVNYSYDPAGDGNLTSRSVSVGNGGSINFNFDRTIAGPHQLLSSDLGSYGYDRNGRQTSGPGRTVTFTEFDLPSLITNTVASDSFQFAYDGLQGRVLKTHSNGDVSITLGDLYERRTTAGTTTHEFTIVGPGGPIAVGMAVGSATPTLFYLHQGHLGSVELITDGSGNVVDQLAYDPFGSRMLPTPPQQLGSPPLSNVELGFAGMQHDDEASLRLINMHGRIYDPSQARFLSVDPLIDSFDSQKLNPYSYVHNNPLTFRDPSGFEDCIDSCTMDDETVVGRGKGPGKGQSKGPSTGGQKTKSVIGEPGPAENGGPPGVGGVVGAGPGVPSGPSTPSATANRDGRNAAVSDGRMTKEVRSAAFDLASQKLLTKRDLGVLAAAGPVGGGVVAGGGAVLFGDLALKAGVWLVVRAYWLFPLGYGIASSVNGGPSLAEIGAAGIIAGNLGGKVPIPRGTNLAFGFAKTLDEFSRSQNAVSVITAWDRKYIQIGVGNFRELQGLFHAIAKTFVDNGGRLKFNLTGIEPGISGATTWELQAILGSGTLRAATDFFRDGAQLAGAELEAALKSWR